MSEGASAALVAVVTWLTPQPALSAGLLVNYGAQEVIADQAWFHGYTLEPFPEQCGLASISPMHLGQIAWVRTDGEWFGPCAVVDVMARHHFYTGVYVNHEVAEVPRWLALRLGFTHGRQGQVWFGPCPPPAGALPGGVYQPVLEYDEGQEAHPSLWPYPIQQLPGPCSAYE